MKQNFFGFGFQTFCGSFKLETSLESESFEPLTDFLTFLVQKL